MILGLESSCDETALALFDPLEGIAGEWIHSQVELHSEHGGVVPDLATREHLRRLGPLLEKVVKSGHWDAVTQVAVTRGPGLAACLAVGAAAGKAIARARRVPIVGVNHLRAHAWSPFIPVHEEEPAAFGERLAGLLPHLGLVVSGGNTLLFSISAARELRQISTTRDDAAGEALDKGAKLLGLGYPGGPAIERLAAEGNGGSFEFPRGIGERGELDFSFSGLKTSLRYRIQGMGEDAVRLSMPDICAGYQAAVVGALRDKAAQALAQGAYRSLGLSGGVANNRLLRSEMESAARGAGARFLAAEPRHTGDNAGMVAFAAWVDAADAGRFTGPGLRVEPAAYL